jgi:hypothetical protein
MELNNAERKARQRVGRHLADLLDNLGLTPHQVSKATGVYFRTIATLRVAAPHLDTLRTLSLFVQDELRKRLADAAAEKAEKRLARRERYLAKTQSARGNRDGDSPRSADD